MLINYIKKIKIKNWDENKEEKKYIISAQYCYYLYNEKVFKYKLKNNSDTFSIDSDDIFNYMVEKKFDYLIINSDYKSIYKEIFDLLEKEYQNEEFTPKEFFNKYMILNFPEINGYSNFINKMVWKKQENILNIIERKLNIDYYNMRIGLSIYLHKMLKNYPKCNKRYFYCNVDFFNSFTSKRKIKKYSFFFLSKLFLYKEYQKYVAFIENDILKVFNKYKSLKYIF